MGKNAKHRASRRQELPRYIASSTFGLVDTENFKGCQVLQWNFVDDQPWVLINHETKQFHINRRYLDPGLTPQDVEFIGNEIAGEPFLSDSRWTNF